MAEFVSTLKDMDWTLVFDLALQAIGFFALVASATPNKSDNSIADFLLRAVNTLGANFGRAGNRPD
jgi:hypothetical protein